MKKQTAVEWLTLYIKGITNLNCDEVIKQAFEMEKRQIQDAYLDGKIDGYNYNYKDYYYYNYEK
jgi:hypothetical protein